ncbi:MAG TPA: hypothetical protein VMU61_14345 [Candidatus Aquilonibacter sp.]|nr:hypothetical protein [Candidatus Aquilonibacter sp.]
MTILLSTGSPVPVRTRKRSLLPLLTVLFLLSYGLMTLLIVFQGSTIQSQRNLIATLFEDSKQLWVLKEKALSDKQVVPARRHAQAPSSQAQAPATATPSTQVPSAPGPLAEAAPQRENQRQATKAAKPQVQLPPKPAADLTDQRRMLNMI